MKLKLHRASLILGALLLSLNTRAATHVWNGAGLTGNWSLPANWQANNPPVAGEAPPVIIYFATGAARLNSTNNVANLIVDSVYFQGDNFVVQGTGSGANLTFRPGGNGLSFGGTGKNNTLGGTLNITLSNSVPFYLYYDLTINSRLIGPGGFTLDANSGSGVLTLNGIQDNQFVGGVTVINGYLQLQNGFPFFDTWIPSIAVPNALTVGGTNMDLQGVATLFADSQLGANCALTINPNGYLYLNGVSNQVGSVTMNGGTLYGNSGTNVHIGTLALAGNITATYSPFINSSISAKINLLGVTRMIDVATNAAINFSGPMDDGLPNNAFLTAGITKTGPGLLGFYAANTYNGLTSVNGGTLAIYSNAALGTTNYGVTVAAGAQLFLGTGLAMGNEPLTLNGVGPNGSGALTGSGGNSWNGPVTLASDSTVTVTSTNNQITFNGSVGGNGGLTKEGPGNLFYYGLLANTYAGATFVKGGTLFLFSGYFAGSFVPTLAVPGYLEIASGTNNASVRLLANDQISDTSAVKIDASAIVPIFSGTLDLNNYNDTIGDFSGAGTVNIGNAQLTVGGTNVSDTFSGAILGTGTFVKQSTNSLVLSGNSSFSGTTFLFGGTMLVNGQISGSDTYVFNASTLGGNGTIGRLFAESTGIISPGNNGVTGKFNCGSAIFYSGSTLNIKLQGTTAGASYDQLNVVGTVTVNAGVNLNVTKTFSGAINNQFTIVNNDVADAVSGTFAGLPNGANLAAGGSPFQIGYSGATGNDIVLTQLAVSAASSFNNIAKLGNGSLQLNGLGTSNLVYHVEASTNLATGNWMNLGAVTASTHGGLNYTDTAATNFPARFYRFVFP